MPSLSQSLRKHDLAFLKMIAQFWGVETSFSDKRSAIAQLAAWMSNPQNLQKVLEQLPANAQQAIGDLLAENGRLPLAQFCRKYGEIRQFGAGRRDRQAIYYSPQSTAESLWFHALVFVDFFKNEKGQIEEYAYLPAELLANLSLPRSAAPAQFDGIVPAEQIQQVVSAQDYFFDDLVTVLAWLRKGKPAPKRKPELESHLLLTKEHFPRSVILPPYDFFQTLLIEAGILDPKSTPLSEPTRLLLSTPREETIKNFYQIWLKTTAINELRRLESLECVGEWENDPIAPRSFLVEQLNRLSENQWYALKEFIQFIHDHFADFQRPGGNYTVWLIRHRNDGTFLKGFESWYAVEGELLRYLLLGPLFWFGVLEIGILSDNTLAFRITPQGGNLLRKTDWAILTAAEGSEAKIRVLTSGLISIPRTFLPSARYQIARFCEWKGFQAQFFHYQISASSLTLAQQSNLKPQQLVKLLQKYSELVPPPLIQAIRQWAHHSTEVQIQRVTLLRVRSPNLLEKIKKSHCAKYLQQILTPTTALIVPGQENHLAKELLGLGYLAQFDFTQERSSATITPDKTG